MCMLILGKRQREVLLHSFWWSYNEKFVRLYIVDWSGGRATPAGTAQNVRRNKPRDSEGCGLRCARGKRPSVAEINSLIQYFFNFILKTTRFISRAVALNNFSVAIY